MRAVWERQQGVGWKPAACVDTGWRRFFTILYDVDCLNPDGEVNERWGAEKEERTLALLRFLFFRSRWPVDPFERVLCLML